MSITLTAHLDSIVFKEKPTAQSDIGALKKRLHKNTQSTSIEQFAHEHCINGKAYSPSIGDGTADGTTEQQVYVLDFDNKATNDKAPLPYDEQIKPQDVEKRLAHVGLKFAFIGFSPSHIPNKWERFRVYIVLDYPLTDKTQIIKARDALGNLFPEADPQAGKLGQFFFGSTKGLYKPVQNVTNDPQILFDIADEHEAREKEHRAAISPSTAKKKNHSGLEPIADLAQKIPIQEAIQAHYSNCSFRQRGRMVNVINHDFGNTSSFFIYEDSNSFCHYARTGNSGKTLGGGVMTFLIEFAKLEPKDAALWVENYLGVSEERKRAFLEDQKREQYNANRFYDEQLGAYVNTAVNVPPQPVIPDTPLPLRRPPQEQAPYPVDALGEFAEVVNVFAEGIKVPHAMAAASVLATLSMCTQSFANIVTPDGRTIPLVLYMLSVADSGDRKSALDRAVLHAVHGVEKAWYKEYQAQLQIYEAALQAWEKQPKKEREANPFEKLPPKVPAMIVENINTEGIFRLVKEGRPSIGIFTDEGGSLFGGQAFQKENILKSITFLSSLWDGKPLDKLRSGEGFTRLYDRRASANIMAQPRIAADILGNEMIQDQGFTNRFLLTWPQTLRGTRTYSNENVRSNPSIRSFYSMCETLLHTPLRIDEETGGLIFDTLTLDATAHELWILHHDNVESKLMPEGELSLISGFASKNAEQALRLAGVLTLACDKGARTITADTMARAIELSQWYLKEALRLRQDGTTPPEILKAERLLIWAQTNGHKLLSIRLIQRNTSLDTKAKAEPIIKILEEHGHLKKGSGSVTIGDSVTKTYWEVVA